METSRKLDNVYPAHISRLPEDLRFGITYGKSVTVLERLGFAEGGSSKTFGYYLKSLRKLGVPFDRLSVRGEKRQVGRYDFCHLMELSLVLTLRVYWTLPDAVLDHVRGHREELYPFYRMAYLEADRGRGTPIKVSLSSGDRFVVGGLFLDPGIRYSGGKLFDAGTPVLLTPSQALRSFDVVYPNARAHPPVNLSAMATRLVKVVKHIGQ